MFVPFSKIKKNQYHAYLPTKPEQRIKIWFIYCFSLVKHRSHPAVSQTKSKISDCLALSHKPKPICDPSNSKPRKNKISLVLLLWDHIGLLEVEDPSYYRASSLSIELKARISHHTSLVGPFIIRDTTMFYSS